MCLQSSQRFQLLRRKGPMRRLLSTLDGPATRTKRTADLCIPMTHRMKFSCPQFTVGLPRLVTETYREQHGATPFVDSEVAPRDNGPKCRRTGLGVGGQLVPVRPECTSEEPKWCTRKYLQQHRW